MEVKLADLMQQLTRSQLADYNIRSFNSVREISSVTGVECRSFESFLKDHTFLRSFSWDEFADMGIRKFSSHEVDLSGAVRFSNLNETFHLQGIESEDQGVESEEDDE